jgi:erythromycin esterase-like protein
VNLCLVFVILCAFTWQAHPQALPRGSTPTSEQGLEQRLREVRYGLSLEGGKLSGTAAPVLTSAIGDAQYILIGEDHLTHEIPQITEAICNVVASQGLSGMALETSPEAAEFVTRSLDAPDRWSPMVALTREYPSSIAFMDDKQENDLVAHCAKVSNDPSFQLWGLDQNFLGSAGWLIDQMFATHPGPAADAELLHLKSEEQADALRARQTGNYNDLFMIAVSDEELLRALSSIDKDGNSDTQKIFRELMQSHDIYAPRSRGINTDEKRATLLKHNFKHDLQGAAKDGKPGKVIVKFGDSHLYKGMNPLHDLNLGDFIAEWADGEGSTSLHIAVLGAKGKHRLLGRYGQPSKVEPFVLDEDSEYRWIAPMVANQLPGEWTLYDLRKLRSERVTFPNADMERFIEGYDLLIIIPELTPAELAN